ncbi:uncharacterized protein LOC131969620 [Centropristis striata]|uniref:uncharacterized protein LOC131969620 n=1 Tax=Centropristis striata TaxID=184440 RepID=UPI0027DFE461|nr:uncharacterized protein LOC131969620 [Centropristis striata]
MDLGIVLTISAVLFMTAEADQTTHMSNDTDTPFTDQTNISCSNCSSPTAASATTSNPTSSRPSTALGLLTITWTSNCKGDVNLILNQPNKSSLPVCHASEPNIQSLLKIVCENQNGCKGQPKPKRGKETQNGCHITESGEMPGTSCETLRIHCEVEDLPDVQGQLHAYKVVTALLCCMVLVLLLIRFTRPTVKALQKRFSERRQNRWVGPTQSHSVSYHRGKTAVKNNDGEKRLSYPALERLAVYDSREPSSNRNSDCNF